MKLSISKKVLAVILCVTMVACTSDQVFTDLNLLVQIAAAIIPAIGVVSPADAAVVTRISNIASSGIAAIQVAYNAYKASGAVTDLQKVEALVNAVKNNLAQELAAAQISNPTVVAKITTWVNLISNTLNAILSVLPHGAKGGKLKLTGSVPTPASIKSQWDTNICNGDAACIALVK